MIRPLIPVVLLFFVLALPVMAAPNVLLVANPLKFTDAGPTIEND